MSQVRAKIDIETPPEQVYDLVLDPNRLVDGARTRDIPSGDVTETALYDWKQLKRWGLSIDSLPPGSQILNREWTLWERYHWYIVVAVTVILGQGLLISRLLVQRARRRRAEQQVRESERSLRLSAEKVRDLASYHTQPEDIGRVAAGAQAGQIVITHLMPGSVPEELVAAARRHYAGPVVVGRDLLEV